MNRLKAEREEQISNEARRKEEESAQLREQVKRRNEKARSQYGMADVDMKKYQDQEQRKRADAYKAAELKAEQSKKMREVEDRI